MSAVSFFATVVDTRNLKIESSQRVVPHVQNIQDNILINIQSADPIGSEIEPRQCGIAGLAKPLSPFRPTP